MRGWTIPRMSLRSSGLRLLFHERAQAYAGLPEELIQLLSSETQ
jgi:hypothetical protein